MTPGSINGKLEACQEIDLNGYVDKKGVKYIGKAAKQPNGKWACLANVAGALCWVEVAITPKEITTQP